MVSSSARPEWCFSGLVFLQLGGEQEAKQRARVRVRGPFFTYRAGLVLQQLQAAPALLQLLVDAQLLLLCLLVTLTEVRKLRLGVVILRSHTRQNVQTVPVS